MGFAQVELFLGRLLLDFYGRKRGGIVFLAQYMILHQARGSTSCDFLVADQSEVNAVKVRRTLDIS